MDKLPDLHVTVQEEVGWVSIPKAKQSWGYIYIWKEHDLGKVNILMENRIIAIWHKMHARLLFDSDSY